MAQPEQQYYGEYVRGEVAEAEQRGDQRAYDGGRHRLYRATIQAKVTPPSTILLPVSS
jgi:hypothetical protein